MKRVILAAAVAMFAFAVNAAEKPAAPQQLADAAAFDCKAAMDKCAAGDQACLDSIVKAHPECKPADQQPKM